MTIAPISQTGNSSATGQGVLGGASAAGAQDLFSMMLSLMKGQGSAGFNHMPDFAAEGSADAGLGGFQKLSQGMDGFMSQFSAQEDAEDLIQKLDEMGVERLGIHSIADLKEALLGLGLGEDEVDALAANVVELTEKMAEEFANFPLFRGLNSGTDKPDTGDMDSFMLKALLLSPELEQGQKSAWVELFSAGGENYADGLKALLSSAASLSADSADALATTGDVVSDDGRHRFAQQKAYAQQSATDFKTRVSRGESLLPDVSSSGAAAPHDATAGDLVKAQDARHADQLNEKLFAERLAQKEHVFEAPSQPVFRVQGVEKAPGDVGASEFALKISAVGDSGSVEALLEEGVDALSHTQHTLLNKPQAGREAAFANPLGRAAARADVGGQVGTQIRVLAEQGGGQIKMTLNPAELGEVDISLEISSGRIHGVITAQSAEVVEQLARDLRSLEQSLAQAGLKLGEEGISFHLQGQGTGQEPGQENAGKFAKGKAAEQTAQVDGVRPSAWVNVDRMLDIRV